MSGKGPVLTEGKPQVSASRLNDPQVAAQTCSECCLGALAGCGLHAGVPLPGSWMHEAA